MSKPRLLDAYSGAGGAARGYQMAGFHVTGIDHVPQPRYAGDAFIQADALEYIAEHGREYDAIHASPPCQAFTQMSARWRKRGGTIADRQPDLLTPTLALLRPWQRPWVVENVVGARRVMCHPFLLHGGMFGLGVVRPRLFESNVFVLTPHAAHPVEFVGVFGTAPDGRRLWTRKDMKGRVSLVRAARSLEQAQTAMGMPWGNWHEVKEAIPPAYTAWIGEQLMRVLTVAA